MKYAFSGTRRGSGKYELTYVGITLENSIKELIDSGLELIPVKRNTETWLQFRKEPIPLSATMQ